MCGSINASNGALGDKDGDGDARHRHELDRGPRAPLRQPNSPDRWRATLNAARTVSRFCDEKIGWNRIGVLLSVAIIAIAVAVLYHILQDIEVQEVVEALRLTDKGQIALAALFVALGYFTLTFYDLFALRTIGKGTEKAVREAQVHTSWTRQDSDYESAVRGFVEVIAHLPELFGIRRQLRRRLLDERAGNQRGARETSVRSWGRCARR
jgi:hypothetical protein